MKVCFDSLSLSLFVSVSSLSLSSNFLVFLLMHTVVLMKTTSSSVSLTLHFSSHDESYGIC